MTIEREIIINPVTRLEGHAKISIFLDDSGNVSNAYYQVAELRGFEKFCVGRSVEEMPRITTKICGVCPWAHHMASAKAVDAVFNVDPPAAAKKLRELAYSAAYFHDHATHILALGGPDFIVGPGAPASERNIVGVINKVGSEVGRKALNALRTGHKVLEAIGGDAVHPVSSIPGGLSKSITEDDRKKFEEAGKQSIEFAKFLLQVFQDAVLKNRDYLDIITGDTYRHETYYMGTVDATHNVNFYDGNLKVIDPSGGTFLEFAPREYQDHIAEHVEPWSYMKFTYLKKQGWVGLRDGAASGVYRVGPLARLNVTKDMATPLAQEAYKQMFEILPMPCHATLAWHWARVIETLYAAERLHELAQDPEITSPDVHTIPTAKPSEGVGVVEAPRGTLIHHYKTNADGLLTDVNLIVATTHNNSGICMSIEKAAQTLVRQGNFDEKILNMVEMAFRAYDPCLACGTHALPGHMPLEISVFDPDGKLLNKVQRLE